MKRTQHLHSRQLPEAIAKWLLSGAALVLASFILSPNLCGDPLDNWRYQNVNLTGMPNATFYSVAYGQAGFIGVGGGIGIARLASGQPMQIISTRGAWVGIAYGNDNYIGVDIFHQIFVTHGTGDMVTRTIGTTNALYDIAFGNGRFVAVGSSGKSWITAQGVIWESHDTGITNDIGRVSFVNDRFLAFPGGPAFLTSNDGAVWATNSIAGMLSLSEIGYGPGQYVAVGKSGQIFVSSNLTDWSAREGIAVANLTGIAHGNGWFVVCGDGGMLWTSPDGNNWVGRPTRATSLFRVAFGQGTFVAVGGGTMIQSDPLSEAPEVLSLSGDVFYGISINGRPGRSYRLEFALNPDGPWQSLATIQIGTSPHVWVDPAPVPDSPRRLYRAVLLP